MQQVHDRISENSWGFQVQKATIISLQVVCLQVLMEAATTQLYHLWMKTAKRSFCTIISNNQIIQMPEIRKYYGIGPSWRRWSKIFQSLELEVALVMFCHCVTWNKDTKIMLVGWKAAGHQLRHRNQHSKRVHQKKCQIRIASCFISYISAVCFKISSHISWACSMNQASLDIQSFDLEMIPKHGW